MFNKLFIFYAFTLPGSIHQFLSLTCQVFVDEDCGPFQLRPRLVHFLSRVVVGEFHYDAFVLRGVIGVPVPRHDPVAALDVTRG